MEPRQTVVAQLPASLVRRAKALTAENGSYVDLSELIELSLRNQLALEADAPRQVASEMPEGGTADATLLDIPSQTPGLLPPETSVLGDPLSPFTNRLFPIKLACRVLANSAPGTPLALFQQDAAELAREVGLRLREEDTRLGHRGMERRWVALPVGGKGPSTINRLINHFTIGSGRAGRPTGPMPRLSLASLNGESRPALTQLGLDLAREANPVLDGAPAADAGTLSEAERGLLARAIASNSAETAQIRRFRDIVHGADGRQGEVDIQLTTEHDWTRDQAAAHRAAMNGRLHDLGLLSVEGEGERARIAVTGDWSWLEDAER